MLKCLWYVWDSRSVSHLASTRSYSFRCVVSSWNHHQGTFQTPLARRTQTEDETLPLLILLLKKRKKKGNIFYGIILLEIKDTEPRCDRWISLKKECAL